MNPQNKQTPEPSLKPVGETGEPVVAPDPITAEPTTPDLGTSQPAAVDLSSNQPEPLAPSPDNPSPATANLTISQLANQPAAQPLPAAASSGPDITSTRHKKSKRRLIIFISLAVLVVIGTVVAYLMLIYIPNKPENVYRRGLASVGVGLEKIMLETDLFNQINSIRYGGRVDIQMADVQDELEDLAEACGWQDQPLTRSISGQLEGRIDISQSLYADQLALSLDSGDQSIAALQIRSIPNPPPNLPKLYFMIEGSDCLADLQDAIQDVLDILDSAQLLEIDQVFDRWWVVDLQQLVDDYAQADPLSQLELEQAMEVSQEIIDQYQTVYQAQQKIVTKFVRLLQKYIFTSDSQQMIFQMGQVLDSNANYKGSDSIKYQVVINRQNYIDFLLEAEAAIRQVEAELELEYLQPYDQQTAQSDAEQAADEFKSTTNIEIWVDTETKILRNIRFTNADAYSSSNDFGNYIDFGLKADTDSQTIELEVEAVTLSKQDCSGGYSAANARTADVCPFYFQDINCQQIADGQASCQDILDDNPSASYAQGYYSCRQDDPADYQDCSQRYSDNQIIIRRSLKAGAEISFSLLIGYSFNFDLSNQNLKLQFQQPTKGESINAELWLDNSSQIQAIEEPQDAKDLIDFLEDLAGGSITTFLEAHDRNQQRQADVQVILPAIGQWMSNNSGQIPTSSQLRQALDQSRLSFYSLDKIFFNQQRLDNDSGSSLLLADNSQPPATATPKADDRDFAYIWTGADCNDSTPGRANGGGAASSLAIETVLETANQPTVSCQSP